MTTFKKAVKHESKLRLAIAGPAGSGKTYSALAIGTALGKTAVVDTEHGSASKYATEFAFDVLELAAPFHPDRFSDAIKAAEQAGYDVVILDSLSHAWNGAGGALELVEQFGKKYRGNSYAAWGDVTPIQNRLIEAIVGARIHVIATMRSKQDYILIEKNGKQMPQKVGMAPVQRDGFEYEFDVFLDMDIDNNAVVSKTRCVSLTGKVINKPGEQLAATLRDWLSGAPAPEKPAPPKIQLSGNGRVLAYEIDTEVMVTGKDDEKPGTIVGITEHASKPGVTLYVVKVGAAELKLPAEKLRIIHREADADQRPLFDDDETVITDGAYSEAHNEA